MEYDLMYEDINERALVCQIDAECWLEFVTPLMDVKITDLIFVYEKRKVQAYFSKKDNKNLSNKGYDFYKKRENLQKAIKIKKNAINIGKKFTDLVKKKDLQKISTKELFNLVVEYYKAFRITLGAHYLTQPQLFYKIGEEIKKNMKDSEDKDYKFITLTTPVKITATKRMEIEMLELASRIKDPFNKSYTANSANTRRDLQEIENKYGDYAIGQGHEKWESKFFEQELKRIISKGHIENELEKIKLNQEELIQMQKDIREENSFSNEITNVLDAASELGYYRLDYTRISWTTVWHYGNKVLEEVGRRMSLTQHNVENCVLSEIKAMLMEGKNPLKKELEQREDFFLLHYKNGKSTVVSGDEGREKKKIILGIVDYSSIKKLTGIVANKGHVQGVAKVISNENVDLAKEIAKVKQGDILIVQNTWPQFLPAMKKAKAIVTNEGGIASHAAVISRELNIPCIVATKYGTMVFKTGDLVEVDGDKGIINKK